MALYIGGTAVDATAGAINVLDGLDRGSIIYGNASSATTVLGQGNADEVLTSDGTDIAWAAGGGGDVSKVGTPANNEVGIWTGDGTIEGDSNLVFDGTTLSVLGSNAGTYEAMLLSNTNTGGSGKIRLEFRTHDGTGDATRACLLAEDDGTDAGKISIQTRDGSGNVEDRMVIDKDGAFTMGSQSQFREVEKDSVSLADGAWKTVAQRTGEEDGLWLVMVGCPGSDNVFGTYWFRSYFAGSGQTINTIFQNAVAAQWSGDNLQVSQGSGGTFTTEWCVYQFDSIG